MIEKRLKNMYDICCVGHITLDKVVTPDSVVEMPGGTSFYFSKAICNMDVSFLLVTSLAEKEMNFVRDLRDDNIEVKAFPCENTVYFENIYPENKDHRTQKVSQTADPFNIEQLKEVDAKIFHLGPLLANDISLEVIKSLAARGKVSLDVQGFLRTVQNNNVYPIDWTDKKEALKNVHILKANESEMEVLTGQKDIRRGARLLKDWGVQEVVITLGSIGSVIFTDGVFYDIPAFAPSRISDTTGCGDTYMAGYLYKRIKSAGIQEAAEFGATMASLKIESPGPFTGSEQHVVEFLDKNRNSIRNV
ncbi:MAG: PfkB family carbohydrate kinase [Ginsengibacter sp.]